VNDIFNNFFYNNTYRGDNDWNLIEEPNSLSLDRYSSTLIFYRQLNKNNEYKYNMNQGGIIEVEENEENNTSRKNKKKL